MSLAVGTVIYQWTMSNQDPSIVYTTKNWDTISIGDDYYDIYGNKLGTISMTEQSGFPTIYDYDADPMLVWERTQGDNRSKTVRESFSQFSKFSDGTVTYSVKDAEARDDITSLTLEKQDAIIGAASSVTNNNLTTSKALISDTFGKISASSVTSTELGYLSGVTSAVQTQLNAKAVYPSQSGNSGKFLTTNGSAVSWATVNALPAQSGQSGKYLTTNGTTASWATVDALPSQSGQSGKYLTTNGTSASWTSINIPTVDQIYDGTSTNAQSGVAVKSAIDSAISSVYKPAGSITFANRPSLSFSIEGNVYNITDAFTTTSDFVEGAGKSYPAGTNIVCINTATSGSAVYKWDVLAGMVDLSGYVPTSRKINNKTLSTDISLTASDVGAVATNSAITGATKCKITYDSKGLVTDGANLAASDIPDLSLSKITDVTATASEVNVLDGITTSTTELNYIDGVTSNVQDQLDSKLNYLDYGLIVPDTTNMKVLRTYTYNVSKTTNYKFCSYTNNKSNMSDVKGNVIFRMTVTGTNINAIIEGIIYMRQGAECPYLVVYNHRGSSAAATTGVRYLYIRYPKALNTAYNWDFEFATYNTTARTVKVEFLKIDDGFTFYDTLTATTYNSTYQTSTYITPYATEGIIGTPTINWATSSASAAGYISSYLPKFIAGTQPLVGEALLAGQMVYMNNNKVYPATNKTLPIEPGFGLVWNSNALDTNASQAYNYMRQKVSGAVTNVPCATLVRGCPCYFRCTMDANGNIYSDNYVATEMTAGYTWFYVGIAQSATAINFDTVQSTFLTLDSNGALTHINGRKITSTDLSSYQPLLVSGTNIKTINSTSLLGSGDISITGLPSQTSQSGKYLTTNGTTASWANVPTEIPSQSGNSGKFLTTNGSAVSWATVDALPSQSGNSGKFLTTNGTTASWAEITEYTANEVETLWNNITPTSS